MDGTREAKKGGGRGRQAFFAKGSVHQDWHRDWQLFKPAAISPEPGPAGRPAGQSLGFLMDYWSLGRYLTCLLATSQPEEAKATVTPDSPSHPAFRKWVVVLILPHSPETGMAHLGGMRLKTRPFPGLDVNASCRPLSREVAPPAPVDHRA
ncbi:unnamed protein product [Pipistrellus nathusii]|uniref:Uncharacterized protein n=1 Tax=Pipistrellus nathusii TaxID=59473 RepID=A0ABN9Z6N1_PIPNA